MKELKLTVTIEEANVIMEALGQMPFAKVYALVAKLQEQAARQLNGGDDQAGISKLETQSAAVEGAANAQ